MNGTIGRRRVPIGGGALAASPLIGTGEPAADRYEDFDWRSGDKPHGRWIDLLTGLSRFRTQFDAVASAKAITASWQAELLALDRRRRPYLLYHRDR